MIIYLASTAPGTEGKKDRPMCDIKMRLLSYWHIRSKELYSDLIYKHIRRIKRKYKETPNGKR